VALSKHCRHPRERWSECGCAWYADYRVAGRRSYLRLGPDRKSAEREHRVLVARLKRGQLPERAAGDGFATLAARWLSGAEQRIGPNTAHGYRMALAHALRWFEDGSVAAINAGELVDLEASLLSAGLSPAYVRQVRGVVMQVLGYAVDLGLIPEVPRMRRRAGVGRAEPRFLEPAQVEACLATLPQPFAAMTTLSWLAGLRPGEVVAMPHQALEAAAVRVAHTVHSRTGLLGPTKNREARRVDLGPRARAAAARLVDDVRSYSQWLRYFHDAQVRAGIAACGLHCLRHSNVALRITAGQPLTYIADQLGHSTASFTLKVYGHLLREQRDGTELERAAALLSHAA
jgi:site-specific recombinase XerD